MWQKYAARVLGFLLDNGQPNLTNCTMKENSADEKGGGVYQELQHIPQQ